MPIYLFTTSTAFQVVEEKLGIIETGNTSTDTAPINPETEVPYFTIPAGGWGSGWPTFGSIPPNPAIQPRDSKRQSFFASNRHNDQPIRLPWGFGNKQRDEQYEAHYGGETEPDITEKPEPEQPEIRESYLLMNTITTVTLPDRIPVDLRDLTISLDIGSFSWELQASLFGTGSLSQIEPDQDGSKQIEVDINGWKWVFIIERYSSNRRFADEQYTSGDTIDPEGYSAGAG